MIGFALCVGVRVFFCEEKQPRVISDAAQPVSIILFQGQELFLTPSLLFCRG